VTLRWDACWHALAAAPPRELRDALLARDREPQRVRAEREPRARESLARSLAKLGE